MRKVNNFSAQVVAVVAMALVVSAAHAVTTNTWKTTCMAPNTPATAYLWNEPSNWDTEQVPAAHDVVIFPQPANVYYVRLPEEGVTVGSFSIPNCFRKSRLISYPTAESFCTAQVP